MTLSLFEFTTPRTLDPFEWLTQLCKHFSRTFLLIHYTDNQTHSKIDLVVQYFTLFLNIFRIFAMLSFNINSHSSKKDKINIRMEQVCQDLVAQSCNHLCMGISLLHKYNDLLFLYFHKTRGFTVVYKNCGNQRCFLDVFVIHTVFTSRKSGHLKIFLAVLLVRNTFDVRPLHLSPST